MRQLREKWRKRNRQPSYFGPEDMKTEKFSSIPGISFGLRFGDTFNTKHPRSSVPAPTLPVEELIQHRKAWRNFMENPSPENRLRAERNRLILVIVGVIVVFFAFLLIGFTTTRDEDEKQQVAARNELFDDSTRIRKMIGAQSTNRFQNLQGSILFFHDIFLPFLPANAFTEVNLHTADEVLELYLEANGLQIIHTDAFENAGLINSKPMFEEISYVSLLSNRFTKLPDNLFRRAVFPSLEVLDLAFCDLEEFSSNIFDVSFGLEVLSLLENPRLGFDPHPALTENLLMLDLRGTVANDFIEKTLKRVELFGIQVFRKLEVLAFGDEFLENIPEEFFSASNFPSLVTLTVSAPNFTVPLDEGHPAFFNKAQSLVSIILER
eukprot:snap_masked-scaffold_48-processed-gene-0.24-mRNA-1 protein AED:1.00 eAED:1.00 QI:0/-1/0/0/-1/1/1/0/379